MIKISKIKNLVNSKKILLVLTLASVFFGIATYFTITQTQQPFGPDPRDVIALLLTDLILFLLLAALIAKRIIKMLIERRKGFVGSRLQSKIVLIFSLIAIIPTIIISTFSVLFLNYGIEVWFNKRVSTAVEESVAIAEKYLDEHRKIIGADILGMTNDLNKEAPNLRSKPERFDYILEILATIRKLPEALVFQKSNNKIKILARTRFSSALEFTLDDLKDETFTIIEKKSPLILENKNDRVIAISKLDNFFNTYLLVGRFIDNSIIERINKTKGTANEYKSLKESLPNLQIKFYMIFIFVTLFILLAVILFAIIFATEIVKPLKEIIDATSKIKDGNYDVKLKVRHKDDEISNLSIAFNKMTDKLQEQRTELATAQRRAAWADIARRIAHEIKNPLTPIQLAADRIKKKYSQYIDPQEYDQFNRYADTIIRHIKDIGTIVEEFVDFARMPSPIFQNKDILKLINESIFSIKCAYPEIKFTLNHDEEKYEIPCDKRQLMEVFENLFKNAIESIEEKFGKENLNKGNINIDISENPSNYIIILSDNGLGFNQDILDNATEPYITSKQKGSGLGLAIVKKILEDHKASMKIENNAYGASLTIVITSNKDI